MQTTRKTRALLIGLMLLFPFVSSRSRSVHIRLDRPRDNSRKLSDSATVVLSLQGGARSISTTKSNDVSKPEKQNISPRTAKNITFLVGSAMASYTLWVYRANWTTFFNKEKLLAKTLEILHHLNEQPKAISYTAYMLGMAVWEALGLSTIPVETASGMVFGWAGLYLSAMGKLIGAVSAFCLARYGFLAAFIQKKLSTNEVLKLLDDSAQAHPLRVTIMLKLSCFPETIKNYGAALLFPIRLWMFTFATIVHGWTFTALWTYLGVDTAMRLEDSTLPVDGKLQILLFLALINGIVVSPLAMALWLKSLRMPQKASTSKAKEASWQPIKKNKTV